MKLTKIFGIVLSLHVAVILLVMFQPGCQTFSGKDGDKANGPDATEGNDSSGGFNAGLDESSSHDSPQVTSDGRRFPTTQPQPGELLVPTEPGEVTEPSTPLIPTNVVVYKVRKGDSLWSIAQKNNITVDTLLSANQISKNSTLNIGQEIFLPGGSGGAVTPSKPKPVSTGAEVHVVQSGDTLSGIARTYGVSVGAIKDANNLRSTIIQIGQRLLVPGGVSAPKVPIITPPIKPLAGQVTHTVKPGESLTVIARTYGISAQLIADMNNVDDPRSLKPGQVLIINPAPITEEVPSGGGATQESIEEIFRNAGDAPVIQLPAPKE